MNGRQEQKGQTPDESLAFLQPAYPLTFVTRIAAQFLDRGDRPLGETKKTKDSQKDYTKICFSAFKKLIQL